ncbi:Maf family protein [Photobacterium aphoticum]|uniref:dTTP/UTP pyrophosphatase n=1 Tax=Photobacterium aphoticum TaxID=754436 RepID=A0A090QX13_9GAMM|nr:Maf family protein [Photobacterium aphoticum]KLV02744.1 septum formation inhibitor Maf [Photobacterium aphoticum]PSU54745.1 septum formation inhibitor Maf [Photobacterium aphoticum]GAL06399.1 septum formation protein Maf [Photobacterium aphoticum]GHA54481.1 Maf-like protein [Photobacterium aphoticum]
MSTPQLYLASGSPRRKELLTQLGYRFERVVVDVEEQHQAGEAPADYVQRLSRDKAMAGVTAVADRHPVLGADTIVVVDETILEKPKDFADAKRMLQLLSGRRHQVMTAVTVATQAQQQTQLVITDVWFKTLSDQEIDAYWQSGEPQDKAGSYGIQGIGGKFVERIDGSYYAVVGLPLVETDIMVQNFLSLSN